MVIRLTRAGFASVDQVADMDLISFNAAFSALARVDYQDRTEQAWTMMTAAQGTKEGMEKIVAQWEPESVRLKNQAAKNAQFLAANKGG